MPPDITVTGDRFILSPAEGTEPATTGEQDDLLTRAQAARLIGVGTATVYRWSRQGEIPTEFTPDGRYRRYRRSVVQQLARERARAKTSTEKPPTGPTSLSRSGATARPSPSAAEHAHRTNPAAPPRIRVVQTNLLRGLNAGRDLDQLPHILGSTAASEAPALIGIQEARWDGPNDRERTIAAVRRALTELYGAPYDLRVGGILRSWHPPALAWRTDVFTLDAWSGPATDQHLYTRNSGWLSWAHTPGRTVLRVQVAHLDYASPTQRVIEAEGLRAQITPDLEHLLLVDGNEIPSGDQFGDRNWMRVPLHKRHHRARLVVPDSTTGLDPYWVKVSDAFDTWCGPWDPHQGRRLYEHAPLRCAAEVDWEQQGRPAGIIAPTTHTDQARHIDWILATSGLHLVPGTFQAHPGDPDISDHKPTSAQYELRSRL